MGPGTPKAVRPTEEQLVDAVAEACDDNDEDPSAVGAKRLTKMIKEQYPDWAVGCKEVWQLCRPAPRFSSLLFSPSLSLSLSSICSLSPAYICSCPAVCCVCRSGRFSQQSGATYR